MNVTKIGLDVVRLRREAGLTQTELAERAGTTQAAISRLENGLRLPPYDTLDRIASELGENLEVVFGAPTGPATREERRRRVRAVLGDATFDPWERDPTPAEARSLIADGLGPERFARA